mgnify:CR=1 FL=1
MSDRMGSYHALSMASVATLAIVLVACSGLGGGSSSERLRCGRHRFAAPQMRFGAGDLCAEVAAEDQIAATAAALPALMDGVASVASSEIRHKTKLSDDTIDRILSAEEARQLMNRTTVNIVESARVLRPSRALLPTYILVVRRAQLVKELPAIVEAGLLFRCVPNGSLSPPPLHA